MLDILCPAGDPGPAAGKDGSRMLRREAGAEIRGGAGGAHSGQVCCVCVCVYSGQVNKSSKKCRI